VKEHQLQAIFGVWKKKYSQKPRRVCAAKKIVKTPDIRTSANTFGEFTFQISLYVL
jgi:hypothetical protein